MKKIIVPVDFSLYSEYALKAAALLAKKHHAELIALHMLELSSAILTDSDNEHQTKSFFYLKLAEKKLEKRSEEHTSELQSRENLVCRLLLEKKKKITETYNTKR